MGWPWSLPACATLGTDLRTKDYKRTFQHLGKAKDLGKARVLVLAILVLVLSVGTSFGEVILAGEDVQATLDKARPGDTVLVKPGQYEPFTVDKELVVKGAGATLICAQLQTPAITIWADNVAVSGFVVKGFPESSEAKFSYYMDTSVKKPNYRLNLPNSAILVAGNDVVIEDTLVSGAEVGVLAESASNVTLRNDTIQYCKTGLELLLCTGGHIESCNFIGCEKYGAYLERSDEILLDNNEVLDTSNAGVLLKESSRCVVEDNHFSGNREGLFLWNSSSNEVRRNEANRNTYYGMVISEHSDNNTIVDNQAKECGGGEFKRFGIGISLQENSSHNVVARNVVENNLNGLELTRGCEFNLICCNNASENSNGIRLDKNQNNLVYLNNFKRNMVNAYDNASHNFWNGSVGNYYSDYRGKDCDGDGIGDNPYWIPKGSSCSVDWKPLMKSTSEELDLVKAKEDISLYANYVPEEHLPYGAKYSKEGNQVIVIGGRAPTMWWL